MSSFRKNLYIFLKWNASISPIYGLHFMFVGLGMTWPEFWVQPLINICAPPQQLLGGMPFGPFIFLMGASKWLGVASIWDFIPILPEGYGRFILTISPALGLYGVLNNDDQPGTPPSDTIESILIPFMIYYIVVVCGIGYLIKPPASDYIEIGEEGSTV